MVIDALVGTIFCPRRVRQRAPSSRHAPLPESGGMALDVLVAIPLDRKLLFHRLGRKIGFEGVDNVPDGLCSPTRLAQQLQLLSF